MPLPGQYHYTKWPERRRSLHAAAIRRHEHHHAHHRLYGFQPENDREHLTAKQLAQMLWYLMDGLSRGAREASLEERSSFNEFHTVFAEVETVFLQSKKTGRWWMQLPDSQWMPCSHRDYLLASTDQMPERWLRAQERP
jgi:formiminoglutamase